MIVLYAICYLQFFFPQEWISSRGSSTSLEQLADSCYRSLQQMDPELLTDLRSKVAVAIEGSNNSQMKEIRGLGKFLLNKGLESGQIQFFRSSILVQFLNVPDTF